MSYMEAFKKETKVGCSPFLIFFSGLESIDLWLMYNVDSRIFAEIVVEFFKQLTYYVS